MRFVSRCSSGSVWVALVVALTNAILASPAAAQVDTGVIQGTVRDSSGGLMPGVTVTLTNVSTNTASQTVTNADGNFQFPALRVGTYSVAAELTGFSRGIRERIELSIQQRLVIDFALAPSGVAE